MTRSQTLQLLFLAALGTALVATPCGVSQTAAQETSADSPAWKLDAAMEQLELYPDDAYLQYVALQLARREGSLSTVKKKIETLTDSRRPAWQRRTEQVNLFSLFSGSLAVQESLQLETMTGEAVDPRRNRGQAASKFHANELVSISDLTGPTIKSHPWQEMLAGREPEFSDLAACIPEDQYYVRFTSVDKMLEVLELNDLWGQHLFSQTSRKAYTSLVDDRLMQQLALQTNEVLRSFYDLVVTEAAITGSDLYLREGSDVTLLFRFEQPAVFRTQMQAFLLAAEKSRKDAVRSRHEYRGIEYEVVATPDRRVHVFAAYPSEDLHLRSNSQVGFQRVIDTILDGGTGADRSLAQSDEFAYIRTLMPFGAKEEDGFVYLSDPFIRRLVGPELKLTERRRVLCYNHLRMIGHACAMYETEQGHPPESLADLANTNCCPQRFGEGGLECPCGGHYSLAEDRHTGICSHHGRVEAMVPCCEIAETTVSGTEAQMYVDFVTQYNEYWRTFFDPIAIRLTVTPERYRAETIILPLINNSIYQGMAAALGGEPAALDSQPVPDRNIFSAAFKVNKATLLRQAGIELPDEQQTAELRASVAAQDGQAKLRRLGIGFHNYHDTQRHLPAAANSSADGKPLLSWRVHLLPYLNESELYDRFRLDEPWDSPHNSSLIEQMPDVFVSPGRQGARAGTTTYLVLTGKDALFDGGNGEQNVRFRDVTDGLSNTVLVVDANVEHATVWTRPNDLPIDSKTLRSAFLNRYGGNGMVLMADGTVRLVTPDVTEEQLRSAITRAKGEAAVEFEQPVVVQRRRSGWFGFTDLGLKDVDPGVAYEFIANGLGDRIGMHVYDGEPTFDFAFTQFLGQAMGSFNGRGGGGFDNDILPAFLLIASLNSPVYASFSLNDTAITDRFLDNLDESLAVMARSNTQAGWFRIERDFYTLPISDEVTARSTSIGLGPIKWRFFWARIGDKLFISSKPEVLEDLARLASDGGEAVAAASGADHSEPTAHAMIRIRPENWNEILSTFQLGWGESHRQACLDNVGRMSSLSRLVAAGGGTLDERAHDLYGVDFFCPCNGQYTTKEGHHAHCSVHGSARDPRQQEIGAAGGSIDSVLREFTGMTLTLTFLEDGLHATLNVDRQ